MTSESVAARLLGRHVELSIVDPAAAPPRAPRRKAAPKPPAHLNEAAKAEWKRVIKALDVTTLDVAALAIYCQAYARWADAELRIAQTGTLITTKEGLAPNPYVKIALDASRQVERLVRIMGLGIADQ